MLNEKSDIYSFGILVLEAVTGRDPIDYGRPNNEVSCYIILIFSHILLLFFKIT
jgi:serine/threonine protein kinase